jgi:ATP-binding cassette subfamily B protein
VTDLNSLAWSKSRITEAIATLARASGLPTAGSGDGELVDVERAAARLGLEAEPIGSSYADLETVIEGAGPALIEIKDDMLLALVGPSGRRIAIVGPQRTVQTIDRTALRAYLCANVEQELAREIDEILDQAGVPARRRGRARAALLRERLAGRRIEVGWILRPAAGARVSTQVRWSRLGRRLGLLAAAHGVEFILGILGWWFVGKGALDGRLDKGWLLAWGLVLFSQIPFRLLTSWYQGTFAVDAGAILKQRLLAGTVELAPDAIRREGAGQLLGRILESEAIESLALNAGLVGLVALIELALAGVVLSLGAGGALHVALLLGAIAGTAAIGWRYHRRRMAWTDARLDMTHDLVERMIGYRTRLAQQDPEHWHDGEDEALDRYVTVARTMDADVARLVALVPRGWMLIGLVGLAPAFARGTASPAALAVAMGGVLLGFRALRKLAIGVASLSGASIAWRRIAPIFQAAARIEVPKGTEPSRAGEPTDPARPIVDAGELVFRYRPRGEAVLRGLSVRIHPGDRILVEGSSGSGKSTLGAVLAGLRDPESGLLLLHGLDKKTLGLAGWRRKVVAAPQFHENHIFSSSFAFNLLMGRAWPPSPDDLALAETISRELDLGPLLERMPAGLQQIVGETGWQLSHGEKSRVFVARALLQGSDVVVLDESFAALDPSTLQRAVACARRRANALLVIAHP